MKFGTFVGISRKNQKVVGPNEKTMTMEEFMQQFEIQDSVDAFWVDPIIYENSTIDPNSAEYQELVMARAKVLADQIARQYGLVQEKFNLTPPEPKPEIKTAVPDGRYSIIYSSGQYRTLRIRTPKSGDLAGKRILSYKEGHSYHGFGFLCVNGTVAFWKRFRQENQLTPERLPRIQHAVDRILEDPQAAGLAYAMKENRCCRCGKELTVPASIHKGLGPDCAGKGHWTKADQKAVYRDKAKGGAA